MRTSGEKLDSGLPMVGRLPPGSRLCQFYETSGELLELVPHYIRAGLENGEFCVWAPPATLSAAAARKAAAGCRKYLERGQLEIIPAVRWSGLSAGPGGAVAYCLTRAAELGFKGLRLACPAPHPQDGGMEKIAAAGSLALVCYPREDFDAAALLETAMKHNLALLRNAGRWEVLESREARLSSDALRRSEEKLESVFSNMSEGFALHRIVLDKRGEPCDYVFLEVNKAFEELTGLKAADIIGKKATQVIPGLEKEHAGWIERYGKVALSGKSDQFESYSAALGKHFSVSAFSTRRGHFAVTFQDITARVQAEEERKATVDFLRLVNEAVSGGELLRRAADFFHERSGCEAFAIRLRDGVDYPYRETRGFRPGFTAAESSLCGGGPSGLPCLCGSVLKGGQTAWKPFFTAHGSFWSGSLPGLLASSPEAAAIAGERGRCAVEGYRSMALVPIHQGEDRLGLLQFNDRREGAFTAEKVNFWERLADQLAVALAKFRAEESFRWGEQRNLMLSRSAALLLGAEDPQASVDNICSSTMRFLDCQVFFNYLADPAGGRLRLNASRGISQKEAARIEWLDYGSAICGCVARDGERITASDIQASADPRAALVRGYGVRAYCCHPLKSGKEVFGTISFGTTRRNAFTDKEISMMEDTAAMVAVAMRRKKADEVVRRDKETLKKLAEAQAGSLLAARAELERAKRLSDIGTLAATVAHELRNPLATIGMAANNVKRKAANPDLEKHLVNIDKKVFESNQIINNLLFYSRLKLPHYEKVSVHDILAESAENAARAHGTVALSVKTGALKDDFLEADPVQLREVANNLLDNAFDAVAPRGGKIELTGASGADYVEFAVRDNGQGVEEAVLPRVFDPFFTTKAKGTGLGLAVCRQIVDFHGGTIGMASVPGRGAVVTVRLPRKRRADAA